MADKPTTPWDEGTPAGTESLAQGDDRIRELKQQLRELLASDHYLPSAGKASNYGYHTVVRLRKQSSDPAAISNIHQLYQKEVSGQTELFLMDDQGNTTQLTSAGELDSSLAVLLTGDQTIAGTKTFSTLPLVPVDDPTQNSEVVSKAFHDDHVSSDPIDHANDSIGTGPLADAAVTLAKLAAGSKVEVGSGEYEGDGSTPRTIAVTSEGAGNTVDLTSGAWLVLVNAQANQSPIIKISPHPSGYSAATSGSWVSNCILDGVATGFTVGDGNPVNANGTTYNYFVLKVA